MKFRIQLFIVLSVVTFCCFTTAIQQTNPSENSTPAVSIISPANNSRFQWDSIVPYSILVSDKEDGSSAYDEIAGYEVFLMVTYLADSSRVKNYVLDNSKWDQKSLRLMSTSGCFTCHAARNKLIGPSFELIARRYADSPGTIDDLAGKIISGTSGSWGDVKMPPHPDLEVEKAKEMVKWILQNNTDPDQTFYVGISGSFRTREKRGEDTGKAVYVLTASYTDHGIRGVIGGNRQGKHTIVLKN